MSTPTVLDPVDDGRDEPERRPAGKGGKTVEQQRAELARLRAIEADLRARIDDIDQRLAIQLGLVVDLRLSAIDLLLAEVERGSDPKPAIEALRTYIEGELRPMSHRLSAMEFLTPVDMGDVIPAEIDDAHDLTDIGAQIGMTKDAISQLHQRLWATRRRAGFALHGGLQAALHVVAMRLAGESSPTPELVAALRQDIQRAIARVTAAPAPPPSLRELCSDVATLWQGACVVTADIAPSLAEAHLHHPLTVECAAEVILELVQNAIRHGRSTMIAIRMTDAGDRMMMEVGDNGLWVDSEAGLGTQMLDYFCADWSMESAESGNLIRATLPYV